MNILTMKISYEFNEAIPVGTKIRFTKNLDPSCRAYDPNLAGTIGVITAVGPYRICIDYKSSDGHLCSACVGPYEVDQIEILEEDTHG